MERSTKRPFRILAGLLLAAAYSFGQANTISAKPGAVNYIEGAATLNGNPLSDKELKSTFLNANDTLATQTGKAEILLTPGVFLRVGEDTELRMVLPSLTDTKIEILSGQIMIEATGLVKANNLQVIDHGAYITIKKNGLYKITADNPPIAAVLDGKAQVTFNDRNVDLKKGRETVLAANLKAQKFDTKASDDLYAWSNVRSEYDAAASYRLARTASLSASNGMLGSGYGPGWYWDNGFSTYAWLPGYGSFYNPFGYGFYSPAFVGYAPVITTSVYRGGYPWRGSGYRSGAPLPPGTTAAVPVSPNHPVGGAVPGSPFPNREARRDAFRSWAAQNPDAAAAFRARRDAAIAAGATPGSWRNGAGAPGVASPGNPNPGAGWHGGNPGAGGWHGGNPGGGGGWHGGATSPAAAGGGGGGGFHGGGGGGASHGGGGGPRSK